MTTSHRRRLEQYRAAIASESDPAIKAHYQRVADRLETLVSLEEMSWYDELLTRVLELK